MSTHHIPMRVVIFGTGSPLIADFEDQLRRQKCEILGAVNNRPGTSYVSSSVPVLSPAALPTEWLSAAFLVPLFTPGNRQVAVAEAIAAGFTHPYTLIAEPERMPIGLQISAGGYVGVGCSIGAQSTLGAYVLINRGANIGHHAWLEEFVSIGPGATLAGEVRIAVGAMVGAGAVVLPRVRVGRNAIVGAGAVVLHDVPDGGMVVGNPARLVRTDVIGFNGVGVA